MTDATVMQEEAEKRHQEVLNMIEALSDSTSSDGASFVCTITECIPKQVLNLTQISRVYSCSHNRYVLFLVLQYNN
jgi:hypothetical protein